ncbi:hypothetical protein K438DRAFT_1580080, partial [Mycena galopus ATCC 62051]
RSGFYFHTKGFTFSDVYLLAGMLHYNFGLHCTVQNHSLSPSERNACALYSSKFSLWRHSSKD